MKELTLKEIFSKSTAFYKTHFVKIACIVLIVYLPIELLVGIIPTDDLHGLASYMRIVNVLVSYVGILATMAVIFVVVSESGKELSTQEALKKALTYWGKAFLTQLIKSILLSVLFLLLIIPGIIYSVYWSFSEMVVVLKKKSGKEALDYSKALVKGRWGTIAVKQLAIFVAMIIVDFVITLLFAFFPENYITAVLSGIIVDIFNAYFTICTIYLFLNIDELYGGDAAALAPKVTEK